MRGRRVLNDEERGCVDRQPVLAKTTLRRPSAFLGARAALAATLVMASPALHAAQCLADVQAAVSGPMGYQARGDRCEGLLRRFVGNSSAVDLIGYHVAGLGFATTSGEPLKLVAIGTDRQRRVTLRAMSLTSRAYYQMDRVDLAVMEEFVWPTADVLGAVTNPASASVDPSKIGIVACSNRCSDRPDTVYWPVGVFPSKENSGGFAYAVVLRSDTRARLVGMRLSSSGREVDVPLPQAVLFGDGVTVVPLPAGLAPGEWNLTVEARDARSNQPLGTLLAVLAVPVWSR
jgi:hypothetical protein